MEQNEKTIKLPIEDIVDYWKADCGQVHTTERGSTFLVVPLNDRRGLLLNLIQTLVDHGYSKEEIETGAVSAKVVLSCWPEMIKRISAKQLKENRAITRKQWDESLKEFFKINISKYKKPLKTAGHSDQKPLNLDTKNRPVYSEAENPDPDMDIDFLNELADLKSKVESRK